jgi:hypothetical protein
MPKKGTDGGSEYHGSSEAFSGGLSERILAALGFA